MKSHHLTLLACGALTAGPLAFAQDATIVNARIAVGDGSGSAMAGSIARGARSEIYFDELNKDELKM